MRPARFVQTVLLGVFAAVGLLATVAVAVDWLQGLDTWSWQESTCTIESSAVAEQPEYGEYELLLSYRYGYRGEEYVGDAYRHGGQGFEQRSEAEVLASRFPAGSEVRCWVDPDEPDRAYLLRADLWQGLWILVPLIFVAVGVGGIWMVRTLSAPRDDAERTVRESAAKTARPGIGVGMMIVFFGIFFIFGTGLLIPFFVRPALQVFAALSWDEVACEIVSSRVVSHPGDDSTTYSIDVLYSYEIDGRLYRSNRYQFMGGSSSGYERRARIVEALSAGASTVCYVDPNDPFEAVIERGFTADYLFGFMPLAFALVGLGGLVFAVGLLRGARKDAATLSWTAASGSSAWSGGAAESTLSAAAGPMVLEPTTGPFGKLGCSVLGALFWNGFISIFVWHVVQEWRAGNPQWFPALILTPFVLIGLLLLCGIPYSILALLNPRPRVHLAPGVLRAGGSAQLEWAFRGLGSRVRHLKIRLEATETRTHYGESSVSIQTRPLDHPGIEVLDRGGELPCEYGAVSFTVPADTPPSSRDEPTIRWRLKLHGTIAYWPDVATEYEVQVLPAESG
jgi:hypothetical protein